jgi:hypothetical protein
MGFRHAASWLAAHAAYRRGYHPILATDRDTAALISLWKYFQVKIFCCQLPSRRCVTIIVRRLRDFPIDECASYIGTVRRGD